MDANIMIMKDQSKDMGKPYVNELNDNLQNLEECYMLKLELLTIKSTRIHLFE